MAESVKLIRRIGRWLSASPLANAVGAEYDGFAQE